MMSTQSARAGCPTPAHCYAPHLRLNGVEVSEAPSIQLDVLWFTQGLQGQGVEVKQLCVGRAPGWQLQP